MYFSEWVRRSSHCPFFSLFTVSSLQFSSSDSVTAPMEAPLPAQYGAPLEPLGFSLAHGVPPVNSHVDPQSLSLNIDHSYPNGASTADSVGSSTTINSSSLPPEEEEEEECLVDSQPICFKENPFLVANRKGKGLPPGAQVLSGPPVGYGKPGQLKPWLFSKASPSVPECVLEAAWLCETHSVLLLEPIVVCAVCPKVRLQFLTVTQVWSLKGRSRLTPILPVFTWLWN